MSVTVKISGRVKTQQNNKLFAHNKHYETTTIQFARRVKAKIHYTSFPT